MGDDPQRDAAQSGEHVRLSEAGPELVADTVRSDLVMDTARDALDERTEAIPTVQGYLEPPSRPVSASPTSVRSLLLASEEVTREVRPRTLPPPRPAAREVFVRDAVSGRARQATGRQPVYVPGAVGQRPSQAPRPSQPSRAWQATPERPSSPEHPSSPPAPGASRPPPLRDDNPITFVAAPAVAPQRGARVHLPWWVSMVLGLTLGFVVATAGFVAWVSTQEPARGRASAPAAAPVASVPPTAERAPEGVSPRSPSPPATTVRAEGGALAWAPTERRTWQGASEGEDTRWSVVLSLRLEADGSVRGYLAWSAVSVQGAREGEQVRENVDGTWDEARGALTLRGTASTNPVLLPVNSYRLHATTAGALRGASIDDGVRFTVAPVLPRRRHRHHDE